MRLIVGSATDVGRVRTGNEDNLIVDPTLGVFAVADGMGGHAAGEVASATALEALRAALAGGRPLEEAIEIANEAVHQKAATDPSLRGMGTTLTALAPAGPALIGHVGDSRAYVMREGQFRQITTDHSLVEELVREGQLTPEEAAVHPKRSIITRALGIEATVNVDVLPVDLVAGDRLVLCSDGLTSMLRDDDIVTVLTENADPGRAARALVDAANEAGGEDNVTVIVIDVLDDEPGANRAPAAAIAPRPVPVDAEAADTPTSAIPIAPGAAAAAAPLDADGNEVIVGVPAVSVRPPDVEPPKPRRSIGRALRRGLWTAIPIVIVIGFAIAATSWYAGRNYYVANRNGTVAIYHGTPGGLLGFNPTLQRTSGVRIKDLPGGLQDDVRGHRQFTSAAEADAYLARLTASTTTTTTTTSSTTTTTAVGVTTTTLKPVGG